MKKRILTILLALCVALTMMPTVAMADAPTPTGTALTQDDVTDDGTLALAAGNSYYLSEDITISKTIEISGTVTLDLNGYVLKKTGNGTVLYVKNINIGSESEENILKGNLTIKDSNPDAKHYFRVEQNVENYNDYMMWIWDKDVTEDSPNIDAYKLVQGGVITGGKGSPLGNGGIGGGGVFVDGGSFTLEKGNIVGCQAIIGEGGGVYIRNGGCFYMKGGCIAGCNGFTSMGNGVYIYGNSEFHMSGGSIIDCYTSWYSCASVAVYDGVTEKGVFTMTSGEIRINNGEYNPIAVKMHTGTMNVDGGAVYGGCVIYDGTLTQRTAAQSATVFYDGRNYDDPIDPSDNSGDKGNNDKVIDFIDNGGLYAWEVVATGKKAVKPDDPEGYKGYTCEWYNGDTLYVFGNPVNERLELTSKKTAIQYNISYDLNGGILDTGKTNPGSYTVESEAITLNNPTKAGYTFLGWSGTGLSGNENKDVTITKGSIGNRTYTANWEDNQAPTFDGLKDGETYRGDVSFTVSDNIGVASVTANGESLTPSSGKYTIKSGSGKVTVTATDNAGNTNTITVTVNSRSSGTTVQKPSVSLGTDAKTEKAADGSTIYTTAEGSIVISKDGRTAAITPADGYEVANVSVNGKNMGAVTTLTGLKTGDEIIVSFQKTEEAKKAEVKAAAAKLDPIARSVKTAKGNIKVTVKFDKETESLIKEMQELGYTVKYKFYRSTKKSSGYKAMLTKSGRSYTNTNGKAGTKYYYKARVQIYDKDGKLITQTALKQCKYASRTWTK